MAVYMTVFPMVSKIVSNIDIFQGIVSKLEIPVLWQHYNGAYQLFGYPYSSKYLLFCKKFIQVWNNLRVSKWWQNFHFWVNFPFNIYNTFAAVNFGKVCKTSKTTTMFSFCRWLLALSGHCITNPQWWCFGSCRTIQPGLWTRLCWNFPLSGKQSKYEI